MKFGKAIALMIKVGAVGYSSILALILISNFSVFSQNWPFGLFASFSSFLIVLFPFVIGVLLKVWRKALAAIAVLALGAFYPFLTFDKMVKPSVEDCTKLDCVSVVAANLRHNENALERLAMTEAKDADILIITEFPCSGTSEQLLALFPMGGEAKIGLVTDPNQRLGSRLAIISRKPLERLNLQIETFPSSDIRPRGIVKFDYVTAKGTVMKFAAVHAPPPKGRKETAARDAYLKAASQALEGQTNFVERITIDHALIGEGIGLVEANILEDVGSDHFTIHLVIHAEDDMD